MILLTALACFGSTPSDPAPTPPVDKPVEVTPDTPPADVEDAPLSQAERDAGFEGKCADGRLVVGFWSGEYPHPVVQVNSAVSAKVRDAQCGESTRACTVPPGLYHPWATEPDKPAGAEFNTLTKPSRYTKSSGSERELVVLTYLAEGACLMQIDGGEVTEDMCPGTSDDGWVQDEAKPVPDVQLMRVACTNGDPGWVHVDEAFMALDGVVEGQMVGWGEVSKSQ
jgi:hypothetical protein